MCRGIFNRSFIPQSTKIRSKTDITSMSSKGKVRDPVDKLEKSMKKLKLSEDIERQIEVEVREEGGTEY